MVLLARVLPLAGALAPAQVLGRELVLAQEPVLGPAEALAQVPVQAPVLGLVSPLHQRLGGAPPSPVAALAPLPETALGAVL